jgi:hypothetical protein
MQSNFLNVLCLPTLYSLGYERQQQLMFLTGLYNSLVWQQNDGICRGYFFPMDRISIPDIAKVSSGMKSGCSVAQTIRRWLQSQCRLLEPSTSLCNLFPQMETGKMISICAY